MEPALDMHDDEIDDLLRLRDLLREARNSMWQLWNRQPLPIFGLILTILLFNLVGCGGGKPEKKTTHTISPVGTSKKNRRARRTKSSVDGSLVAISESG